MTFDQEQKHNVEAQLELDWAFLRYHFAKWRNERLPGARREHRYQVRQRVIGIRHGRAMLAKLGAV